MEGTRGYACTLATLAFCILMSPLSSHFASHFLFSTFPCHFSSFCSLLSCQHYATPWQSPRGWQTKYSLFLFFFVEKSLQFLSSCFILFCLTVLRTICLWTNEIASEWREVEKCFEFNCIREFGIVTLSHGFCNAWLFHNNDILLFDIAKGTHEIVMRCIYANNTIVKSRISQLLQPSPAVLRYYYFVSCIPREYADTVTMVHDETDDQPQ